VNETLSDEPITPLADSRNRTGSVFLGRLPIYDTHAQTQGYVLFGADGVDDRQPFTDRDATVRQLYGALKSIPELDDLITGKSLWVPASLGEHALPPNLPSHRTTLCFDPVALASPEFFSEADRLRRYGFRIALDVTGGPEHHGAPGLVAASANDPVDPFQIASELGAADVLDALLIPVSQDRASALIATATEARRRRMTAVAVGVDTISTSERFASSFDLCIGRFVFQPSDVGPAGSVDRLAAVQLLAELERPNSSFEDVERVIGRDPSLVLRMLALANSGMFSLPRRIDTTRAALVMLGLRNVRQLALAVTLHSVTSVAPELTLTALVRAKHCELIAAALGLRSEVAFTVGLLSLVGTFTGRPTEEALSQLPLTTEVVNAIAKQSGLLGDVLAAVLCCERGRVSTACLILDALAPSTTGPEAHVGVLASTSTVAVMWAERLRAGSAAVAAVPPTPAKPKGLFRR
jgi:HDOD domain